MSAEDNTFGQVAQLFLFYLTDNISDLYKPTDYQKAK